MFTKADRGTWKYWFAHWCAFQMTALNLKCWKFKYLFHDIEKPFMKMVYPYSYVQKFHRFHNKHHPEYFFYHYGKDGKCDDYDFEATVIDWECSRFTKTNCPRNAKEEIEEQYKLIKTCNNKYINNILSKYTRYYVTYDVNNPTRYTILVEKFFEKMREKLAELQLN